MPLELCAPNMYRAKSIVGAVVSQPTLAIKSCKSHIYSI